MNIKEDCRKNKLSLIALHKFVQESADAANVSLDGPLKAICEDVGVNRTHVYERKKQIEDVLETVELPSPGRPKVVSEFDSPVGYTLREQVLRFRLDHPGAVVNHESGRTTYSDGFVRFILDLFDEWEGSPEQFCKQVEVPYQTLSVWVKKDKGQPYNQHQKRSYVERPGTMGETARQIAEDYAVWEGSLREFLKYEAARLNLAPSPIRRVLQILAMVSMRSRKGPRYRGSTTKCEPGSILVTDGKAVNIVLTYTSEQCRYNWQGIVDQATICHTAAVVTDVECADGVHEAFEKSSEFLGRSPQAVVHDNKPIHHEQKLRGQIEKTTTMIPATLNRAENKAGIEGEFGKFVQTVSVISLDDRNKETLIKSAVSEIIRAYTTALNHAGRFEFNGKSREQVLREACPDPEKDRRFIEELHASHTDKRRIDILPTQAASCALLDEGFKRFEIEELDPGGKIRTWLSGRYTPAAIRQGLAIFGAEWEKGRLRNKTAHRYLVKVIQNCQTEIDLRNQEELLREFVKIERPIWLHDLEMEYQNLMAACDDNSPEKNLAFCLSEKAAFGGLPIQRAFWENKLKIFLERQLEKCRAVCRHVRRLFEVSWEERFSLISKIVAWEHQLAN